MIDCMTCLTVQDEYRRPHGVHRDILGIVHGTILNFGDLSTAWVLCEFDIPGALAVPWVEASR